MLRKRFLLHAISYSASLHQVRAAGISLLMCAVMLMPENSSSAPRSISSSQAPELSLEKSRHDFGEVFAGEDLIAAFWIRNLGSKALELSDRPLIVGLPRKAALVLQRSQESGLMHKTLVHAAPG